MSDVSRTLVLGIGNTLLTDEGAGIYLLNYIRERHSDLPDVTWLDGGTLSFTLAPTIEDHERLVVLDAAQLNKSPGTIKLFENEDMDAFIGQGKRSVHEVGLVDLMSIVRLQERLPVRRALLGIQPDQMGWGEQPSQRIIDQAQVAEQLIINLLYRWDSVSNT